MASPKGRLTALQSNLVESLARRAPGFFLTGGAVLVGWTLGHRTTDDLDLFTTSDEAMIGGPPAVLGAAEEVGAIGLALTTTPDFHRFLVSRGADSARVDLVRDRTSPLRPKVEVDGVRMDSVEEIVANKIAALVGRSELRDLIDLRALEARGYRVEDYLDDARKKDGGVSPATIAWLLSSTHAPPNPEGATQADLEEFVRDLERRMLALAAIERRR